LGAGKLLHPLELDPSSRSEPFVRDNDSDSDAIALKAPLSSSSSSSSSSSPSALTRGD
jgi:hypothetical protein